MYLLTALCKQQIKSYWKIHSIPFFLRPLETITLLRQAPHEGDSYLSWTLGWELHHDEIFFLISVLGHFAASSGLKFVLIHNLFEFLRRSSKEVGRRDAENFERYTIGNHSFECLLRKKANKQGIFFASPALTQAQIEAMRTMQGT